MLTAIKGYYEKGQVILREVPPVNKKTEVIVTFLSSDDAPMSHPKRILGLLEGKITISDDFNEPLNDLKDYM